MNSLLPLKGQAPRTHWAVSAMEWARCAVEVDDNRYGGIGHDCWRVELARKQAARALRGAA